MIYNKYFISFLLLYLYTLAVKFLKFPAWNWIQFYLADILALPIICTISLKALQWIKNDATLYLSSSKIFVTTIYLCIFFEWFLPKFSTKYISDLNDCIAYLIGGVIFWIYQKYYIKPNKV